MSDYRYTPDDYLIPVWKSAGRVHEWMNYISDELRAMWETFTPEQRAELARNAYEIAGREEWD